MRQFDIFENPAEASRSFAPYLVVLSSHLLSDLTEVVVAPLIRRTRPISELELAVRVESDDLVLAIVDLSSVLAHRLRRRIGDLADREDAIRRALERLFSGF